MRWQVFGPHVQGLGRCGPHAQLSRLPPKGLLYQLLGACALRGHSLPSLAGLRYMLMRMTHRHHALDDVLRLATGIPPAAPALRAELDAVVGRRTPKWKQEVTKANEAMRKALLALQEWLRRAGRPQAADAVVATAWVHARDERRGMLFVRCEERLLPRPLRVRASSDLDFDVMPERYK
jgi:hypothetical protein